MSIYTQTNQKIIDAMIGELNIYLFDEEKRWKYMNHSYKEQLQEHTNIPTDVIDIIDTYTQEPTQIYDPCFGTGFMLDCIVSQFKKYIHDNNVYGTDKHYDAKKAQYSKNRNISQNDCIQLICDNTINIAFDIIVSDLVCDSIMNTEIKYKISLNKFGNTELYPYISTYCELMIIQRCIYNSKKNGIIQLVVHNNVLIDECYAEFRMWLLDRINIVSIYFILTGIKTSCIVTMLNNGNTKNIKMKVYSNPVRYLDIDTIKKNKTYTIY